MARGKSRIKRKSRRERDLQLKSKNSLSGKREKNSLRKAWR